MELNVKKKTKNAKSNKELDQLAIEKICHYAMIAVIKSLEQAQLNGGLVNIVITSKEADIR